ncbi:hypothetical protein AB5J52_00200 [Streptomyces sp. R39]|uniref:Uncharacterized protein n=1 Tax=Streptomyces sp. R39 TaxID=3238631 RepID=A0AB39QE83_9ACTN
MITVTFGSAANSQEEFPTLEMRITEVSQQRDTTKVYIEDGQTGATGQRAHVTSNIVFLNALQDLMLDKTWVEAWSELHSLWVFSQNLLQQWYGQTAIAPTHQAGKKHKKYLEAWTDNAIDEILPNFERDGFKLDQAWYVVPKTGSDQEKRAGRIYFGHEPTAAEYDTVGFDVPLRWKPNLHTDWVADLNQQLEEWLQFRSEFPWTSVDASSYVTSDRAGLTALDTAIDAVGVSPTGVEARAIAQAMIMTFDFFPDDFTKTRTIDHASALAARHVVEHFRYRPKIQATWRKKISDAFLIAWNEKVKKEIQEQKNIVLPTKKQKTGSTTAKATASGRPTTALKDLIANWAAAETSYRTYYTAFARALS